MVTAIVEFENGATGNVVSSTCIMPAFKHRVEIHGTKGTAIMNGEYDKVHEDKQNIGFAHASS